jgi:hypothetical protein
MDAQPCYCFSSVSINMPRSSTLSCTNAPVNPSLLSLLFPNGKGTIACASQQLSLKRGNRLSPYFLTIFLSLLIDSYTLLSILPHRHYKELLGFAWQQQNHLQAGNLII